MTASRIRGAGMTDFRRHDKPLRALALNAARAALLDAGLGPESIDMVLFANSLQGLLDG